MKRNHSALFALALAGCLFGTIHSPAAVHYVNAYGANATPPYTNWLTAATNIQDAVNIALAGETIIVTNGVYPGTVNVTNPVALRSVTGPQFTIIDGGGTNRCIVLTNGASLTGFTLTNGYTDGDGAGVWCASTNVFLTNCVITGNSAVGSWHVVWWPWPPGHLVPVFGPANGGGVERGTLYQCTLTGNSANLGGGAASAILYNCTMGGNRAMSSSFSWNGQGYQSPGEGGGVAFCTLNNCIVYFNSAAGGANYWGGASDPNYCCTTPLPADGVGNITNAPLFVDDNNGDLHLQTNSPGINAGNNAYVATTTDLDGNPRIAGGTVDMGAYEFQPCITGGQFCDAACSRLAGFSFTFSGGIVGQPYRVQTSTNLAAGSWTDLTNFDYTGPVVITDLSAVAGPKKFYRAVSP